MATSISSDKYEIHLCKSCINELKTHNPYIIPMSRIRIVEVPESQCDNNDVNNYDEKLRKRNSDFLWKFNRDKDKFPSISETTHKCIIEFNRNNGLLFPNSTEQNNWYWNFEYFRFNTDGSITCKASEEALNVAETQSLAIAILWENNCNAQLAGEDGCMNNYEMYTPIYFPLIGLAFNIPHGISDQFARGKEVTIYGYEPDKEELLDIIDWWNNHY